MQLNFKDYGKSRNPLEKIESGSKLSSMIEQDLTLMTKSSHVNEPLSPMAPTPNSERQTNIDESPSSPVPVLTNVLDNYDIVHTNYTRGINITQTTFQGTHHFCIWEFSGYEPYRIIYDKFVGSSDAFACIHLITYNLTRSQAECLHECVTWLEYLRSRISDSSMFVPSDTNANGTSQSCTIAKKRSFPGVWYLLFRFLIYHQSSQTLSFRSFLTGFLLIYFCFCSCVLYFSFSIFFLPFLYIYT